MHEGGRAAGGESQPARRLRRLREQGRGRRMEQVNHAVRQVWEQPGGPRPDQIWLRRSFLHASGSGSERRDPPISRLVNPRGIALRFYLMAVFEAQCRPPQERRVKVNSRPLSGSGGWGDLFAIDAAYSRPVGRYQRPTKQNRDLETSVERQVKGALRTLEEPADSALVEIPRKQNGRDRDYDRFTLMKESGRGRVPTPDRYAVPGDDTPGREQGLISMPSQFFLRGWIQVLYSSEIATWLVLRLLRSLFPRRHDESGVFLYGQVRESLFHLLRDTYEDGCRNLVDFGLIRHAPPVPPQRAGAREAESPDWATLFMLAEQRAEDGQARYQPNRYQLTDTGLDDDGLQVAMTTFQGRRNALESAR
jgi:hypothetical protein